MAEEEYPGFSNSVRTGKCEFCDFCDNSNDPRLILDHLLAVHGLDRNGKRVQPKDSPVGGSVSVRAHSRKRPRR
jgi:hypothetical protein